MQRNSPRNTARWQLDLAGIALLFLLIFIAWNVTHPFTIVSFIPLVLTVYAAWRIIFELTWNRYNVPTLATGFIARHHIASILEQAERESRARRSGRPFTVIDLGSGRGELARYLGRSIPNSHIIGIEIARLPHLQATYLQNLLGPKNVTFECFDFLLYDASQADAVIMYLSGNLTIKVGEKLARELQPRSLIIANTFPLAAPWQPERTVSYRTPFKERLYIYRK